MWSETHSFGKADEKLQKGEAFSLAETSHSAWIRQISQAKKKRLAPLILKKWFPFETLLANFMSLASLILEFLRTSIAMVLS